MVLDSVRSRLHSFFFHTWFRGKKMCGQADKTFLCRINGVLLCLTSSCMYHASKTWCTEVYIQHSEFSIQHRVRRGCTIFLRQVCSMLEYSGLTHSVDVYQR